MKNFFEVYIKKHWVVSIIVLVLLLTLSCMTYMGTLSYPYIMVVRQIQMLSFCHSEHTSFDAVDFGFQFEIPSKYCFLPNREYPKDTTVQLIPSGPYFVLNEYIKGTVVENTRATIIFEPVTAERNPESILDSMAKGGFLQGSNRENILNKNGVKIILIHGAKGIESSERSDWAFVLNKKGDYMLTLLLTKRDRGEVFTYLVENLHTN